MAKYNIKPEVTCPTCDICTERDARIEITKSGGRDLKLCISCESWLKGQLSSTASKKKRSGKILGDPVASFD